MNTSIAIFAAGCFWCVEGQFLQLKGVEEVMPGYIGGHTAHPTYEQVCNGTTGHAEAIMITYNPDVINYEKLLQLFFVAHDPTQLNRQGNDIGTQYRSAIFPTNEEQKLLAEQYIQMLNTYSDHQGQIVTTIELGHEFYPAEDYHKNYFANNPQNQYCQLVVQPKIKKFISILEKEGLLNFRRTFDE